MEIERERLMLVFWTEPISDREAESDPDDTLAGHCDFCKQPIENDECGCEIPEEYPHQLELNEDTFWVWLDMLRKEVK